MTRSRALRLMAVLVNGEGGVFDRISTSDAINTYPTKATPYKDICLDTPAKAIRYIYRSRNLRIRLSLA